jgi:hypothetical protein
MTDNKRIMHTVRGADLLPGNIPSIQYGSTKKYLTRLVIGTERGAP